MSFQCNYRKQFNSYVRKKSEVKAVAEQNILYSAGAKSTVKTLKNI